MSSVSIRSDKPCGPVQKCRSSRLRIESLVYLELGPGNGGFLIDLNKGGMAFQGIQALDAGRELTTKFKLPGSEDVLETTATVVWLNELGKGGGLRFTNLPQETRRRLNRWLAMQEPAGTHKEVPSDTPSKMEGEELRCSAILSPTTEAASPVAAADTEFIAQVARTVASVARASETTSGHKAVSQHPHVGNSAQPAFYITDGSWEWTMPVLVGVVVAALIIALCFALPTLIGEQFDGYPQTTGENHSKPRYDFGLPKAAFPSEPIAVPENTSSIDAPSADLSNQDSSALSAASAIDTQGMAR